MRHLISSFICVLTLSSIGCFLVETPKQTLDKYYKHHAPDSEGMDPLILAGERVVPLVIEKIADANMPKRQGAINFLGNGGYRQAIPALERILFDESEHEYVRADALVAIFRIDHELGMRYANTFKSRGDTLAKTANEVFADEEYLSDRRTYYDALIGRHD